MEGIELISFQIISAVGAARSCYIEAIQLAKKKDFDLANEKIKEGDQLFNDGHHAHGSLIQKEAAGEKTEFSIILMHAEDQLMSAEGFRIISEEFVDLYRSLN